MENSLSKIANTKKIQWKKLNLDGIKKIIPTLQIEQLREWSIGPYSLMLAKPYIEHCSEFKYYQHPKLKTTFKIKGMTSRFSKKQNPKKYTVLLDLPQEGNMEDILSFCTCKTGARTLGGCVYATAILFHLTIEKQEVDMNDTSPLKAKNRSIDIIDIKDFKNEKKRKRGQENIENEETDIDEEQICIFNGKVPINSVYIF